MRLSAAIFRGLGLDPLDSALSVVLKGPLASSVDARCRQAIIWLNRSFPDLGRSVRTWPKLAVAMEEHGVLEVAEKWQKLYRPQVHKSLWRCITDLHDIKRMAKDDIARILYDRAGL